MKQSYRILVIGCFLSPVYSYSQEADYSQQLSEFVNKGDWDSANKIICNHREDLDSASLDFINILIKTNTNQSREAINGLKRLLETKTENNNLFLVLHAFLLENYDNLHDYHSALSACTDLLQSQRFSKEVSEAIAERKSAYAQLAEFPKFQVRKTQADTCFNYTYLTHTFIISSHAQSNGADASFIFDTGSSRSVVREAAAERMKIKRVKNDSVLINNKTFVSRGVIDSLQIGNYLFFNFPVAIVPSIAPQEPALSDTIARTFLEQLEKTDLVIGMDCLRFMEEWQIDTQKRHIYLPSESSSAEARCPMFLSRNRLYLKSKVNDVDFIGFFDTGMSSSITLNNSFYKENMQKLPEQDSTARTMKAMRFEGVDTFTVRSLRPVYSSIYANKKIEIDVNASSIDEYDYNGGIGNFIFRENDKIVFNFREMWFCVE